MKMMNVHKNQEGAYTVQFYDRYGRYVNDKDLVAITLIDAQEQGRDGLLHNEEASSFLVRRNVYNSVDHM